MRMARNAILGVLGLIWLLGSRDISAQQDAASEPAQPAAAAAAAETLEPAVDVSGVRPADEAPRQEPAVRQSTSALALETTSITGTQELPRVLYIVPWKQSDLGDLVGRPVGTLIDEVLAPLDPEVFERHLEYYDALHGEGQKE